MLFSIPTITDLLDRYRLRFKLSSHESSFRSKKCLDVSGVQRPGLALAGYLEDGESSTLFIFGKAELDYLRHITASERACSLQKVVTAKTPAVIVAGNLIPIRELVEICREKEVHVLCSQWKAKKLLSELSLALAQDFAPCRHYHGTLVRVYGTGVMIEGEAGIGKSEAALGLVAKGHQLIADDRVLIRKRINDQLIGKGAELSRHLVEVRGIGLVNVAHLYGAGCVQDEVEIDMVIRFEEWRGSRFCGAIGLDEQFREFLGVNVPFYSLPIRAGRNSTLLMEAIVLNHRTKSIGYDAAREFHFKLSKEIAKQE
ncbi:MAG: HPr(Ser) kinase/phosphatase [Chlamydiota bacterium]